MTAGIFLTLVESAMIIRITTIRVIASSAMMTLVKVELRRWTAIRAWASGESCACRLIGGSWFDSIAGTGGCFTKLENSFSNFLFGFRVAMRRFGRNLGA